MHDDAPPPPEDAADLGPDADHEAVARKILLDQLTGQARSRSELGAKLAGKKVRSEIPGRVLARFEEVGLVDDAAFARDWVESRQAARGLARRALTIELRGRGVDQATAEGGGRPVDPEAEEAPARELVRRKLPSLARYDEQTVVRRLTGML